MSRPTSRRSPPGNVSSIARNSGRLLALGNGSGARNSIHPLAAVAVDGHALRLPPSAADEGSTRK